jgi:hypothetical protein
VAFLKVNADEKVKEFISSQKWISLTDDNLKELPPSPGIYVVRSGNCISHIGKSRNIKRRVSQLLRLTNHRGSAEVLCVAFCTQKRPEIYYEIMKPKSEERTDRERELKKSLGEPPTPSSVYKSCKDGKELRTQLLRNADQWQSGYIDATFEIGEFLRNLFRCRFEDLWKVVGKPPGWENFVAED